MFMNFPPREIFQNASRRIFPSREYLISRIDVSEVSVNKNPSDPPTSVTELSLHVGAVALSRLCVSPLDSWRVMLQISPEGKTPFSKLILRSYRGVLPNTSGAVVFAGLYALSQRQSRSCDTYYSVPDALWMRGLATVVSYPLDTMFTLSAVESGRRKPISIHAMYRGISLGLLGVPVSVGASFATLAFLGLIFPLSTDVDFATGFFVGSSAALAGSVAAYPIDTVRRRLIWGQPLREAVRLRYFYRGLSVHCFKSVPECILLGYGLMCNLRYFSFNVAED